jgi:hypothetical protein
MLPFLLKGASGMSTKGDRAAPRTVADIERKYNFGRSFSEIIGLIDDTRKDVSSVESSLRDEITKQSTSIRRDTEEIVLNATQIISNNVDELSKAVELKMNASDVSIQIKEELASGVDGVRLETGYVFDSNGLNISKSGDEMTNLLNHTGMYVERSGNEVLTANNKGVTAVDLHAKTYLKIGSGDGSTRFEDYGAGRVGCFWTGG